MPGVGLRGPFPRPPPRAAPPRRRPEEAGDEIAGALLAARGDLRLRGVAPALGDVFAREVDDGVAAGEPLRGGAVGLGVPRDGLYAERLARALGVARQHRD